MHTKFETHDLKGGKHLAQISVIVRIIQNIS